MRKLLTLLFALANIISFAANLNEEIRDGYTLANDNYSGVCAPVPEMREIYGGTVFRVFLMKIALLNYKVHLIMLVEFGKKMS